MLRISALKSGLGFAGEFHQSRTLAAGVRTHDRLADVAGCGQHLLPFQEQLRTFRPIGGFLCRSLDPDFPPRGISRTANPENESSPIRRWGSAYGEAGVNPHRLVMPGRYGCDL